MPRDDTMERPNPFELGEKWGLTEVTSPFLPDYSDQESDMTPGPTRENSPIPWREFRPPSHPPPPLEEFCIQPTSRVNARPSEIFGPLFPHQIGMGMLPLLPRIDQPMVLPLLPRISRPTALPLLPIIFQRLALGRRPLLHQNAQFLFRLQRHP